MEHWVRVPLFGEPWGTCPYATHTAFCACCACSDTLLIECPPDILSDAAALSGSSPFYWYAHKQKHPSFDECFCLARHEGLARMLRIRRPAHAVHAWTRCWSNVHRTFSRTQRPFRVRVPLFICTQIKRALLWRTLFIWRAMRDSNPQPSPKNEQKPHDRWSFNVP